ncbi:hypothetical protein B0H11DRAFT_2287551 [Mycena galericulata]|nr:hypothetical protein B0H11DRAFT_2287551 [Mycena galericulata]
MASASPSRAISLIHTRDMVMRGDSSRACPARYAALSYDAGPCVAGDSGEDAGERGIEEECKGAANLAGERELDFVLTIFATSIPCATEAARPIDVTHDLTASRRRRTRSAAWFGTFTPAHHTAVLSYYTKMAVAMDSDYNFDCTCTNGDTNVHIYTDEFGTFYRCGA